MTSESSTSAHQLKLYIGLCIDSTTVNIDGHALAASLDNFANAISQIAACNKPAKLPFDLVLLVDSAVHLNSALTSVTQTSHYIIEQYPNEEGAANGLAFEQFLQRKANIILCLNTTVTENLVTNSNLINQLLTPEKTTSSALPYFFSTQKSTPFLYNLALAFKGAEQLDGKLLNEGFITREQLHSPQLISQSSLDFKQFLLEFKQLTQDLNKTPHCNSKDDLANALTQCTENGSQSLHSFYQFTQRLDNLANIHQSKSNLGFTILFSMTLILGASFLLYAKVFTHSPWLLIVYLLTYCAGVVTFYTLKKRSTLNKHLAYRLGAETLRLKLFQLISHNGDKTLSVDFERSISNPKTNTSWISHLIRAFPLHQVNHQYDLAQSKQLILKFLIEDQLNYFKQKLHGKPARSSGLESTLSVFSTIQLVIIISCFLLMITVALTAFKVGPFYQLYPIKHLLMFLIGFFPVIGLALEQLVFNFAYEENELRYQQQIDKYNVYKQWLLVANSPEKITDLTNKLCLECAQENFNWYSTRMNRRHKPASGG